MASNLQGHKLQENCKKICICRTGLWLWPLGPVYWITAGKLQEFQGGPRVDFCLSVGLQTKLQGNCVGRSKFSSCSFWLQFSCQFFAIFKRKTAKNARKLQEVSQENCKKYRNKTARSIARKLRENGKKYCKTIARKLWENCRIDFFH